MPRRAGLGGAWPGWARGLSMPNCSPFPRGGARPRLVWPCRPGPCQAGRGETGHGSLSKLNCSPVPWLCMARQALGPSALGWLRHSVARTGYPRRPEQACELLTNDQCTPSRGEALLGLFDAGSGLALAMSGMAGRCVASQGDLSKSRICSPFRAGYARTRRRFAWRCRTTQGLAPHGREWLGRLSKRNCSPLVAASLAVTRRDLAGTGSSPAGRGLARQRKATWGKS
jgi:hypothetical protein